jgi:rod shape determining protein RodA
MIRMEVGLPLVVAAIIGYGFVILNSAAPSGALLERQLLALGVAVVACALLFWLGRERIVRFALHAYVGSLCLLLLLRVIGRETYGAQRWLELGPVDFQPSELAKLSLVLVLSITLHERPIRRLMDYARVGLLVGIPAGLIFLEPDLGTSLVLVFIGIGTMFVRGIPLKHFIAIMLLLVVTVPTLVLPNLKPHQKARIVAFLDPTADPQGSGYQVIQSRIAIGSGGLTGKGLGRGTQSQLGFIPFSHTDFIFPVLAEELGFVGSVILLLLYGLLFWRLAMMAIDCPKQRDRFIIVGVLSLISFQVFVNVGVALGLAPVTGITLPLVSYGGTSLLSTVLALGIAYVIHRDRYREW